jgi:hypothetical protein
MAEERTLMTFFCSRFAVRSVGFRVDDLSRVAHRATATEETLTRPKISIPGIAQSRNDVAMIV